MNDVSFRRPELDDFLDRLAAPTSAPGGGSAAGLSGALAAALLEMAAGLTSRKKGVPISELDSLCRAASRLRQRLAQAPQQDASAYSAVEAALKLPQASEAEISRRRERVQGALCKAAQVPLDTAEQALQVLKLAAQLLPLSGKQLTSDISCAVRLALACVEGSLDNVDANALSIMDTAVREKLKAKRTSLLEETKRVAEPLMLKLETTLSAWR